MGRIFKGERTMKKLFFEMNKQYFQYTVHSFELKDGFYHFTDIRDHKKYKLSKEWYRGEMEL